MYFAPRKTFSRLLRRRDYANNLDKLGGRFPIWADTLVSFSLPFLRKWQKSSKWSYAFNEIKIWRARCAPKYSDNMHENWLENMILSIFHNFHESKSRVQMRALKIFCYEFILLTLLKVPKFWMNRLIEYSKNWQLNLNLKICFFQKNWKFWNLKMNVFIYKGTFANKDFENKKLTLLGVVWW